MMKLTALLSALLAVLLLAGPSFAAGTMSDGHTTQMTTNNNIATRNALIGLDVVNGADESIGVIKNVNVNPKTGKLNYVILDEKVGPGMPGKSHAVPLAVLKILPDEGTARLTVSQNVLETTPAKQVGMTDEQYTTRIEEHYGVAPTWNNQGKTHKMMQHEEGYQGNSGY